MTQLAIDLPPPAKLSRAHVLLRILIWCVTGALANAIGWPGTLLYFGLPVVAGVLISQHGAPRYLEEDGKVLTKFLAWLAAFWAYMSLLTDRFPLGEGEPDIRLEVTPSGTPTLGSALLRIVMSLPLAFVLALLGIASSILWLFAAIAVLFVEHYPRSWFDFQCGMIRAVTRLLVYHASLTDQYPPFGLELGPSEPLAPSAAAR